MEIFSFTKRPDDKPLYQIVLKVKEVIFKQGKIDKIFFENLVYLDMSNNNSDEDIEWCVRMDDLDSIFTDCYVLHELGTTDEMVELFL